MLLPFTLNRLHTLLLGNQASSPHPLSACTIRLFSQKTHQPPLCSLCAHSQNTLLQWRTSVHSEAWLMLGERHPLLHKIWCNMKERTVKFPVMLLPQLKLKAKCQIKHIHDLTDNTNFLHSHKHLHNRRKLPVIGAELNKNTTAHSSKTQKQVYNALCFS